jgi:hypothetical protein
MEITSFRPWLHLRDTGGKPVTRFDLLRPKGITFLPPEHAVRTQEYLDKKRQRRAQAQVTFRELFPRLAATFVPLAERGYRENASYHLQKILDLLSIYDKPAMEQTLGGALHLGTPSIGSVQALLKENLKQPGTESWRGFLGEFTGLTAG